MATNRTLPEKQEPCPRCGAEGCPGGHKLRIATPGDAAAMRRSMRSAQAAETRRGRRADFAGLIETEPTWTRNREAAS